MNLNVEFALPQALYLFRRQTERSSNVTARRGRNGEIANRRPADAGRHALMNLSQRSRALHSVECSGDGKLVPASTAETEPDPVISARLAASIPTGDNRALNLWSVLGPAVCAQAISPSPRTTPPANIFPMRRILSLFEL